MAYGKTISTDSMNAHKKMAGAAMKGDFRLDAYPGRAAPHPDLTNGVGQKGAMDDAMRTPPMGAKGRLMQRAPDHGPAGNDHFRRDGKA